MRRETVKPAPSRAVSPWFRLIGDGGEAKGDAAMRTSGRPMHRGEWWFLGVLVPLVVTLLCFEVLWWLGGGWLAWLGCVPAGFAVLHVVVFALRIRSSVTAFWIWAVGLGLAAGWMLSGGPAARVAGWLWLGFLGLNLAASGVLAWRWLMGFEGRMGVALRLALIGDVHLIAAALGFFLGWPAGLGFLLGGVAVWAWGTFVPTSGIFGPVARRVDGPGPLLTIDDGPHPGDTPAMLDALDEFGVKAVFFVIGENVREFPELAREIVARGHELGNHTMTHPQATMWCAGPGRTRREIEDGQRAIEEVTGLSPRWFRAPVGHRNLFTHPVARELELEVVAWSRRAFDTRSRDVDEIVRRLADGAGDGDVLLLHEATPVAREVIRPLLERLRSASSGR